MFRLIFLALFFFAGVVLGQVLSAQASGTTGDELKKYLTEYFSLSDHTDFTAKTFLSALIIYFRYPLLAFLLGFASVGVLLLPALSAAYGFFLSFSVCCFAAAFGENGVLLALSVFGIRCLVTLPCYFMLAVPSFGTSASLAAYSLGRGQRVMPVIYGKDWWLRLCISSALLLAGALTELFLSPYFLRLVLARIFSMN